ncbi:MAG: sodium/proton-translocating pyrophosphatase, partial [Phycisphaerae bacterium]
MAGKGLRRSWISHCWKLVGAVCLLAVMTLSVSVAQAQDAPKALTDVTNAITGAVPTTVPSEEVAPFKYFSFLDDPHFTGGERAALFASLAVAVMALLYAWMLVKQVVGADKGTKKMQEIAAAVREGSDAYLARQLRVVGVLIVVLVFVLFFSKKMAGGNYATEYAFGRAGAFLVGAIFSALVGFVGMRMATTGNLRVAAAAQ